MNRQIEILGLNQSPCGFVTCVDTASLIMDQIVVFTREIKEDILNHKEITIIIKVCD